MAHYKDPNTLAYGVTAISGCMSITTTEGGTPETMVADAGTFTHFVRKAGCTATFVLNDAVEARQMANKTTAATDITFEVNTEADAAGGTVTCANAKTGGISGGFSGGGDTFTVVAVCDTVSDPTP